MEIRLTGERVARIRELLEVMNERRTVIAATAPGDAERIRAWSEYGEAQKEVEAILPTATQPLR